MALHDEFYDENDQINNYLQRKTESKMDTSKYIYISINRNFDNNDDLNKILYILNQNMKLVDSIVKVGTNHFLKIDISKNYDVESFEYLLIKDSIVYSINYFVSRNFDDLLYLKLDEEKDLNKLHFNLLVTYSAKNKYFKPFLKEFYFENSDKINFDKTFKYVSYLNRQLDYDYVIDLKKSQKEKNLKRKMSSLTFTIVNKKTKCDESVKESVETEPVEIKSSVTPDSKTLNSKKFDDFSSDKSIIDSQYKLIVNQKTYFINDKKELMDTIKILDFFKIKYNIQILVNEIWNELTPLMIQILLF